MLLAVRGVKIVAPFIGFFEVLIWIFAVGNAIRFLDSPLHLIGYASGFAMGTVVGMMLEERIAFGMATVRVVPNTAASSSPRRCATAVRRHRVLGAGEGGAGRGGLRGAPPPRSEVRLPGGRHLGSGRLRHGGGAEGDSRGWMFGMRRK
jgi:hypothetical protein